MIAQEARQLVDLHHATYHTVSQEIEQQAKNGFNEALVFLSQEEIDGIVHDLIADGFELQIFHGYLRIRW